MDIANSEEIPGNNLTNQSVTNMKLTRGRIPLYQQLEQILRQRIYNGIYDDIGLFPTDYQICDEFDVSRITVRQALKILESDALIRREQGRGTFVINRKPDRFAYETRVSLENSLYFREGCELVLKTKALIKADSAISLDMGITEGETLYHFQGTQNLDKNGKYYEYVNIYVPEEIGCQISTGKVSPIFIHTLEQLSLESITQFKQIIYADSADKELAEILNVHLGYPLLISKNIFTTRRGNVVGIVERSTPGNMFQYINNFKIKHVN